MKYDYLVVGSGLYGAVFAKEAADRGKTVLVIDKRPNVEMCIRDRSRGKPAVNQLDMTMDYLDVVNSQSAMKAEDGMDVRNYGGLDGITEAKKLICLLYTSRYV